MAGSDQIWNYRFPKNRINDNFLTFADEQKRIAVSASFGVDTIPPEMQQRYIEGLSGFSHLSVREKAGADIIYDLLRVKVPVLIDPVMLLSKEDWLKVAGNPKRKYAGQYILKYYLGNDDNTIHKWAKDNDYVVYDLLDETIPDLYQADPGEFISLIDKATLICSDSFHCIVMAIIFSKPFIVFRRKGQENYMFSRLETLLEKFGFQNRVADLIKEDEYLKCDFNHVERILTEERQKFKNYISVAMEIEGRKES